MWRKHLFDEGYSDAMVLNVPVHPGDVDYMNGWNQAIADDRDSIDYGYEDDEIYDDDDF